MSTEPEDFQRIVAHKLLMDNFDDWRDAVRVLLPELSKKVFDLRSHTYLGCGFHWSLERDLGYVICKICDFDDGDLYHSADAMVRQCMLQVRARGVFEDVAKIENDLQLPGERLLCPI